MKTITLDLATWSFLAGTVVPILVALTTKLNASSAIKGAINLVLSAVAGLIATAIAGGGVLTQQAVVAGFLALLASVASYYGGWKPVGVTGAVATATAQVGLGSSSQPASASSGATLAGP